MEYLPYLDNRIPETIATLERNIINVAKYRQRVLTSLKTQENPVYQWVQASSQNELNDLIVKTYIKSGRIWEFMESTATAPVNDGTTFAAYVETWLSLYKVNTLKPTTLRGYRTMLTAHLLPTFGNCNMHDIKPADVQAFLNEHKYLARSYLMSMITFMSQVFKDAIEDGIATEDPTASRKIVIPSDKVLVRDALSLENFKDILANLHRLCTDDRRMMALMMLTGMRRGEALGLRWEDLDLKSKLIHIQRNVTFAQNQPHIGTPKSAKGERDVPISSMLLSHLEPLQEQGFIIGDTEPISRMSYRRRMERIEATIDLHGATAHIFRHSYLTYAAGLGTDLKTLQSIAGHADIQTTMNRYVHKQNDKIIETGNRLQNLFSDGFVQIPCTQEKPANAYGISI